MIQLNMLESLNNDDSKEEMLDIETKLIKTIKNNKLSSEGYYYGIQNDDNKGGRVVFDCSCGNIYEKHFADEMPYIREIRHLNCPKCNKSAYEFQQVDNGWSKKVAHLYHGLTSINGIPVFIRFLEKFTYENKKREYRLTGIGFAATNSNKEVSYYRSPTNNKWSKTYDITRIFGYHTKYNWSKGFIDQSILDSNIYYLKPVLKIFNANTTKINSNLLQKISQYIGWYNIFNNNTVELLYNAGYKRLADVTLNRVMGTFGENSIYETLKKKNVTKLSHIFDFPNSFLNITEDWDIPFDFDTIQYIDIIYKKDPSLTTNNLIALGNNLIDEYTLQDNMYLTLDGRDYNNMLRTIYKLVDKYNIKVDNIFKYINALDNTQALSAKNGLELWYDYLEAEIQIYASNNDIDIEDINISKFKKSIDLFPAALHTKYDIAARNAAEIKLKIEEEQIECIVNKNIRYENIKNEKYAIILPKSPKDLLLEGSRLNHCVGSYINRMFVSETSVVLFIREIENIKKSLYTVEVRNKHINQIRGYRNSDPDYDVELNELLDMLRKEAAL